MEELFGDPAYKGFVLQDQQAPAGALLRADFRRADLPP